MQRQMSYRVIKDSADLAKLKCNQDKTNLTFMKDYILFLKNDMHFSAEVIVILCD